MGIKLIAVEIEGTGFAILKLPDEEAPRLVNYLESAIEALNNQIQSSHDDEKIKSLKNYQRGCRSIAMFTRGGGWAVLA